MQGKRSYSDEFKRDAIRLLETSGKRLTEIEKELGLPHGLLRKWQKRFQVNPVSEQLELSDVEQLKGELRALKRELEIARMEHDILKNGGDLLEGQPSMKYEAIERMQAEYPVERLCTVLGVSESGYYAWLKREPCQRAVEDATLKAKIVLLWQTFRRVYGAPRLWQELRDQGIRTSIKRVARLMREAGIQGKMARRKRPRTTQTDDTHPVAPNLLNRQFSGKKRNDVWLSDITYIETGEGYLYLAGVLDLGSREMVGLAMADHMRTELVDKALEMSLIQQRPRRGIMHHSDRGSQYTSVAYQQKLRDHGFIVSMSRTGNCLDNAPMESFWVTLKRECADHVFPTRDSARIAIFSYIMGFYNRVRRHAALGYRAPIAHAA